MWRVEVDSTFWMSYVEGEWQHGPDHPLPQVLRFHLAWTSQPQERLPQLVDQGCLLLPGLFHHFLAFHFHLCIVLTIMYHCLGLQVRLSSCFCEITSGLWAWPHTSVEMPLPMLHCFQIWSFLKHFFCRPPHCIKMYNFSELKNVVQMVFKSVWTLEIDGLSWLIPER